MAERLYAAATQRNREPILAVLRGVLPERGAVLEIASGTGEHAVWLAAKLPGIVIQPSDPDPDSCASIAAWVRFTGVPNVRAPVGIDTTAPDWDATPGIPPALAAILCINMIHISPWSATEGLIRGAARVLPASGLLFLYGPYRCQGQHTAPSNAAFDADLRRRNPAWGVRDMEAIVALAAEARFAAPVVVPMPANNFSLLFRRAVAAG